MSLSTFLPTYGLLNTPPDQLIELIYAGNALAHLHTTDTACLCGKLTGPAENPAAHTTLTCPIARFYTAVNAIHTTINAVGKAARQ